MRLLSKLGFLQDHLPVVIVLGVVFALAMALAYPLIISRIDFGGSDECATDSRPAAPVLVNVTQDPETLTITAEARDESDNEQWFTLERTIITRANQYVAVGTDIPSPDSSKLPLSRETGRSVFIVDRGTGLTGDQTPIPGQQFVYTVRAINCFGLSERSNDLTLLSLSPE